VKIQQKISVKDADNKRKERIPADRASECETAVEQCSCGHFTTVRLFGESSCGPATRPEFFQTLCEGIESDN
jgi:hypothetical protein